MWKLNRPGVGAPGRCGFLSLASQRAAAVVGACDEHETDNREPRDHEGNSDHVVVLSVFRALLRRASAVQRARFTNEAHAKWSSASVMLRAMPACRPGDVTGCLADELAAGVGFAPTSRRLTGGRSTVELPGNGRGGGTCTPGMAGCKPAAIAARRHLEIGARDRTRTD